MLSTALLAVPVAPEHAPEEAVVVAVAPEPSDAPVVAVARQLERSQEVAAPVLQAEQAAPPPPRDVPRRLMRRLVGFPALVALGHAIQQAGWLACYWETALAGGVIGGLLVLLGFAKFARTIGSDRADAWQRKLKCTWTVWWWCTFWATVPRTQCPGLWEEDSGSGPAPPDWAERYDPCLSPNLLPVFVAPLCALHIVLRIACRAAEAVREAREPEMAPLILPTGTQPIAAGPGPQERGSSQERGAHIRNIRMRDDEYIRSRWSQRHEPLAEYRKAAETICLADGWLSHTRLGRHLRWMDSCFEANPGMQEVLTGRRYCEQIILRAIRKGYQLDDDGAARQQMDAVVGRPVFKNMCRFMFTGPPRQLGGRGSATVPREYVAFALQVLTDLDTPTGIVAKLSEVVDRSLKCATAHNQALQLLVSHSFHLRDAADEPAVPEPEPAPEAEPEPAPEPGPEPASQPEPVPQPAAGLDDTAAAKERFLACFEDALDDHKEMSFTSAFIAPLRFYLVQIGDRGTGDGDEPFGSIMLHGINWWLALVHSTLGFNLPFRPDYNDSNGPWAGVADFWQGLDDNAWAFFGHPENFGKWQVGVPTELRLDQFHRRRVHTQQLPHGFDIGRRARDLGNAAVNTGRPQAMREGLAIYLERFAFFFRAEYFCKRMFEILNAEVKAEHAGFRKASETLYRHWRESQQAAGAPGAEEMEDTLAEYCYVDEWFAELDVHRVQLFFAWLGVVKAPSPPDAGVVADRLRQLDDIAKAGLLSAEEVEERRRVISACADESVEVTRGDRMRPSDVVLQPGETLAQFFGRHEAAPLVQGPPPPLPLEEYGEWTRQDDQEAEMLLAALGGAATRCPACGMVILKHGGDDQMMCGCEAAPAGGTMDKALRGGGCGHMFNFRSGRPLGQGKPGQPANARQWRF